MIGNLAAIDFPAATVLPPDNRARVLGVDYERGAPEGALDVRVRDRTYLSRVVSGAFEVSSDGSTWTEVLNVPGASRNFTFSFDALMRPVVAYQLGDDATAPAERDTYLYWYDNTIPGFTTLALPAAVSPFLHYDFSVDSASGVGEVLLFYIRGTTVYYRKQNDRFTIEHTFGALPAGKTRLTGVGLGTNWRLHVRCGR